MQLSVDALSLISVVAAVVIPLLVWEVRKVAMIKETLEMHRDPDAHGFGTKTTNGILAENTTALREICARQSQSTDRIAEAVKDLTHYIRWLSRQQTGQTPPPPLK